MADTVFLASVTFDFKNPHHPPQVRFFTDREEADKYFEKKKTFLKEFGLDKILTDDFAVFETKRYKLFKTDCHFPKEMFNI